MAARFLVPGGSGLWNNVNNWSATTGGAAGASFPIAGDDVTLDNLSASVPMTVNVASACASLTLAAGYAGTLTVSSTLTLTGNYTTVFGVTVTGAGTIVMTGTATITTNGITIGCGLSMQGTATYTLVDSFAVTGLLTFGLGSAITTTVQGAFTITANGGLMQGGTSTIIAAGTSTPTIKIGTTSTITGSNNTSARFGLHLTIDAPGGTVTFANVIFMFGATNTPTLTYVSGTVVQAGSTSTLQLGGPCTLTTAGIVWNKIVINGAFTITATTDVTLSGLATFGGTSNALVLNGSNWKCGGGIRSTFTTGGISGTSQIIVTGAGTLDSTASWTGRIASPFVINAPGAAIVITSAFNVDLGLMQLVDVGSITTTQGNWTLTPAVIGTLTPPTAGGNARLTTDDQGSLRVIRSGPAAGPLSAPTDFANLQVRVDDQGSLVIAVGAAGSVVGPLTNASNIRLRTDSTGALVVNS